MRKVTLTFIHCLASMLAMAVLGTSAFAAEPEPPISLHLSTDALANVFVQGEKLQIQACVTNRGDKIKMTLNWEIFDARGSMLANGSRRLALKSSENRTETINLKSQVGYYAVRAKLLAEGKTLASAQIDAGVVPKPVPCENFGLWIGDSRLAQRAGAGWTRTMAYWRFLEMQKGNLNWNDLDNSIKEAKAAGLKILVCFHQIPDWASSAPKADPQFGGYPPKNWEDLSRFVAATAARYGNEVDAWEIWNEPVISWGAWKGSNEQVVKLHRVISEALRSQLPNAIILGPCIASGGVPLLKLDDFRNAAASGVLDSCNGLAIHPYREPRGPESTFFMEELAQLTRYASERKLTNGLWITEMGWSAAEYLWEPKIKVSELEQADYLVRSMVPAVAARVKLFNWHNLVEWCGGGDREQCYGIVRTGNAGPKPAYVACAVGANQLADARFICRLNHWGPPCPDELLGKAPLFDELRPANVRSVDGYLFDKTDTSMLVIWSISGRVERISIPAAHSVKCIDIYGQASKLIPKHGRIDLEVTGSPVYLMGLDKARLQ